MNPIQPMKVSKDGELVASSSQWYSEEKADGTRIFLVKEGTSIHIKAARSWNDYTHKHPDIVAEAKKLKKQMVVLDGELAFFKTGTKQDQFLPIGAKEETRKGFTAKAMIFDVLYINGKSVEDKPIEERKKLLKTIIPPKLKLIKATKMHPVGTGQELFDEVTSDEQQGEGIVLKRKGSQYHEGIRSPDWKKYKKEDTADCIIVGVTKGTGVRKATFGALILGQFRNGKLVYVGKASGFSDAEQQILLHSLSDIQVDESPSLEFKLKIKSDIQFWTQPKIVVECEFMERTPKGVMRHPRFLRIREDKPAKECVF